MCWTDVVVGPLTSSLIIIYCYFLSPAHERFSSIIGFVAGAFLAALLVNDYPECHPKAYTGTYIPLFLTCLAGALTIVLLFISEEKRELRK
jgi:hypothetical protein